MCTLFTNGGANSSELLSKWEKLCSDPPIYVVRNFLTEAECVHIGKVETQDLERSYMEDELGQQVLSSHRTSRFTALRKFGDEKVRAIEQRAAEIVGLHAEKVEPMQVVQYEHGEEFGLHHDCAELKPDGTLSETPKGYPTRLVTVFAYITTVGAKDGGSTEFPLLNLKVQPERGMAVVFANITEDGQLDARVQHAALPLANGATKLGMNVWISTADQLAYVNSSSGIIIRELKTAPPLSSSSSSSSSSKKKKTNSKKTNSKKNGTLKRPRPTELADTKLANPKLADPNEGGLCSEARCWAPGRWLHTMQTSFCPAHGPKN